MPTHVIKSMVGKLKTRVGKVKNFFGASRRFFSQIISAHPGLKPCRRPWRHCSSGRQQNLLALSRGRHLYLAGRPSRWTLAHIVVPLKSSFGMLGVRHTMHSAIRVVTQGDHWLMRLVVELTQCWLTNYDAPVAAVWLMRAHIREHKSQYGLTCDVWRWRVHIVSTTCSYLLLIGDLASSW